MRWLPLLLAVMLSGCAGTEPPEPLDATPPPPEPPLPELAASLTLERPANATAPMPVAFTVDAPGAAEADNVSWRLTATSNGTEALLGEGTGVPATANHTFEAGAHVLRLEVREGDRNATAAQPLLVDAAVGNATGNATDATDALDVATMGTFTGAFAGDPESPEDGPVEVHTLPVPEDAVAVHLWADWSDNLFATHPFTTDIDVRVLDGAGAEVVNAQSLTFEYAFVEGAFAAGDWTIEVLGYDIPADVDYTVELVAWSVAPQTASFSGTGPGAAPGIVGGDDTATPPDDHALALPPGTQTVAVRMTWSVDGDPCGLSEEATHDFDFEAILDGTVRFGRGNFGACEFGATDAEDEDLGGDWTLRAKKFLAGPGTYEMLVFYA